MSAHETKIRVMKTVSAGTKEIIQRRVRKDNLQEMFEKMRHWHWFTEMYAT